jgi:hypothetical protein
MKSFYEMNQILNESNNIANKPQYHNIEILGWSLSKGTLPPWGRTGDDGINITSVFAGRASDPESTRVYNAALKLRKENPNACEYIHENVKWLRRNVRVKAADYVRKLQYIFMTGKVLNYGEEPPEDFVAPDVGGGPDGNGSGSQPSGISGVPNQSAAQVNKQVSAQPQKPQAGSKVVTCPHCKKQFNI